MLARTKWPHGLLLAFSALSGRTDYAHGLTLRTLRNPEGLEICHPAPLRLTFPSPPSSDIELASEHFRFRTKEGETVCGVLLDAHHLLISGPCESAEGNDALAVVSENERTLIGSRSQFQPEKIGSDLSEAYQRRSAWLDQQTPLAAQYPASKRTLLGAFSVMKGQIYSPEGAIRHLWSTPDRWPHRDMWLWDSAFHVIGWRHLDPSLARQLLDAVFDLQQEDGFISLRMSPNGVLSDLTQPPVLALAAESLYEKMPDRDWLATIYPKLAAYLIWDKTHRDENGSGLMTWRTHSNPLCRSGESGMDNSPRFDSGQALHAVDFNAFLASEYEIMADFASLLGFPEDEARWAEEHRRLCRLMNEHLWCDKEGFYIDSKVSTGRKTGVLSSAGFLPLICGAASTTQAASLLRQLENPSMFGTPFPVPSIPLRDHANYDKDMWRGPVWINVNWLIIRGLERYGFRGAAERLRAQTIRGIECQFEAWEVFFEYYDDRGKDAPTALKRKGKCAPEVSPMHQVLHDFGWSTTLYVDLLLSEKS